MTSSERRFLARSVSAGTHRLFPELEVDRLRRQPAYHGGPWTIADMACRNSCGCARLTVHWGGHGLQIRSDKFQRDDLSPRGAVGNGYGPDEIYF
jgi:hypothetical protein